MALARLGIFYFIGRSYRYYDAVSIQSTTRVLFRREPDNPHGPNVIAVLDPRTEVLYGYVNKGFAARLAKRIGAGLLSRRSRLTGVFLRLRRRIQLTGVSTANGCFHAHHHAVPTPNRKPRQF